VTVRVLLADDQPLIRAGLRALLGTQPDLEVVGEAADGAEATRRAAELGPAVVLMDVRMPGVDGIAATRKIVQAGHCRVLILTTYDQDEYVFDTLAAGASGFLLKDTRPEDLVNGIRMVAVGEALLAPSVTKRLISVFAQRPHRARPSRTLGSLTGREREVLTLVAGGWSNAEIGERLHISGNTVKTHVRHLLEKLELRDRVHVVIFAYENGLV
jgi:DNA-binding NarL/FixJ family response regulator